MPIDLSAYPTQSEERIFNIQRDLQLRADELRIAYEDPETFERERNVKVADLEATFTQLETERDQLLGVVTTQPTIEEEAAARAEFAIREAKIEAKKNEILIANPEVNTQELEARIAAAEAFKSDGGLDE